MDAEEVMELVFDMVDSCICADDSETGRALKATFENIKDKAYELLDE